VTGAMAYENCTRYRPASTIVIGARAFVYAIPEAVDGILYFTIVNCKPEADDIIHYTEKINSIGSI
jgi:hypothetical protein